MFVVASWNVNSILARLQHVIDFLKSVDVDVLMLQELKCVDERFPYSEFEDLGYNCLVNGQKTYNGVAIISKFPIEKERTQILNDGQARYIEALVTKQEKVFRVSSVYVPNGKEVYSEAFQYKISFLETLGLYIKGLLKNRERIILAGDYNVAPEPIDVYNPIELKDKICFHYLEQQKFAAIKNLGITDAFRFCNPSSKQFSWWDYRAGAWNKNHGMRIDHILMSPGAADSLVSCKIADHLRSVSRPSDHAPIIAEFSLDSVCAVDV